MSAIFASLLDKVVSRHHDKLRICFEDLVVFSYSFSAVTVQSVLLVRASRDENFELFGSLFRLERLDKRLGEPVWVSLVTLYCIQSVRSVFLSIRSLVSLTS